MQSAYKKRHKVDKHDRHGKHRNKDASKQTSMQTSKTSKKANKQESKQNANKQESKQKVVFAKDKCRFGSNVHSFIVLKHG